MKRLLMISSLVICLAANAIGQVARPQTAGKANRKMAKGAWQVVRTIGLDTDLFEKPIAIAAMGERFVVADGVVLRSFTVSGTQQWRFGRDGSGPGEFRQILSVAMDSTGNTLVYDGGIDRLTVIDAAGKLKRVVPLQSRTDRATFSTGGRYLLLNTASDTLARVVDSLGVVSSVHATPSDMGPFAGLSREMSSISRIRTGHLVTFRWSSRMLFVSAHGVPGKACTGIDSLSFPDVLTRKIKIPGAQDAQATRIDPRARQAALRATMLGDQLVVEPLVSISRRHVLDVYARDCGGYIESRPFPYPATQMAGARSLLVAMLDEPVPHIVMLRWVPR